MFLLKDDTKILLDSDVIRHLIKGDKLSLLHKLFGDHLVLLKVVYDELFRSTQIQPIIENFIKFNNLKIIEFPSDNLEILKEYANLKKRFGDGESACMAVAKFQNNIIASSNLKDIKDYCIQNKIVYLTTMDILLEAVDTQLLSEDNCNHVIQTIKAKNSKLPVNTIAEYRQLINN